jgi:outer membrane receptor protein involved in Fe transport
MVDITGLQSTIFDASIVNLFFSDNAADAEISGLEGDFVYVTGNGLMLSGAFSFLDSEIVKNLVPATGDIVVGDELAFAPGYQGNLAARKEWGLSSGNTGHWQAQMTVSDSSFSDIMQPNRAVQDKYSLFNVRAGISNDEWTAEVYIDNLMDKNADISNTFIFDRQRVGMVKPRTLGIRYKKSF